MWKYMRVLSERVKCWRKCSLRVQMPDSYVHIEFRKRQPAPLCVWARGVPGGMDESPGDSAPSSRPSFLSLARHAPPLAAPGLAEGAGPRCGEWSACLLGWASRCSFLQSGCAESRRRRRRWRGGEREREKGTHKLSGARGERRRESAERRMTACS